MGGIVMAATISANSAGGGGLVTSGDASGVLALQTAGVTALSISAAQVVSFTNPVTLTSPTLTSPTLTTPTINSAQVPTISGTAPLYMCRAWVNFNGTGTVAIRASGNVSSITDNGTGDYTVNFTTAMPDTDYSVGSLNRGDTGASNTWIVSRIYNSLAATSVGACRIQTVSSTNTLTDAQLVSLSIFR
jgi:hypothetical protein